MIASTTALPATTATTTVIEQFREGSSVNAASRDARVGAAYRGLPDRILHRLGQDRHEPLRPARPRLRLKPFRQRPALSTIHHAAKGGTQM